MEVGCLFGSSALTSYNACTHAKRSIDRAVKNVSKYGNLDKQIHNNYALKIKANNKTGFLIFLCIKSLRE